MIQSAVKWGLRRAVGFPSGMFSSLIAVVLVASMLVTSAEAAGLTLNVVSASDRTKVPEYKFIINKDNTGTTTQRSPAVGTGCSPEDAGYPNSCAWTSIAGAKSSSPVYTQGTEANATLSDVPDGRYLISVLADGYKLDGKHFCVGTNPNPSGDACSSSVTVELQPTPLPDAQIQAAVFEDVSPVNSATDLPAEHGLAGFQGHILDVLGEVTTDVYGAPLCGTGRCLSACYVVSGGVDIGTVGPIDSAGRCPTDPGPGFPAGAAVEGKVKIPNLGPNRYTLSVTPPDGSGWVQTTTLEGNHDWDAWVMEGATGLDTEFVIAGEPFPAIIFGYVPAPGTPSAVGSALGSLNGSGTITGVVEAVKIYVPTTGGVGGLPGEIWGGLQGAVPDKPIDKPWVTLTDLGNGDTIVWAGQGGVDGKFTISGVPAGTYTLTWWDEPQNEILDLVNVTVGDGETVDMGMLPLSGWWTFFDGYVFNDTNRNGIKDAGEPGLSGYTLTMRRRDNSLMDRGTTLTTTDATGYYKFEAAYPMTQWLVMEAYDDLHYGTGVTYQADNQPTPTTVLGAGVDVSVLPIIGLSGRMDWGKHNYDALGTNGIDPRNGGIVGTVSYDTTRNELDPRYAAVEDWQPSISDLVVKLYAPTAATPGCVRLPAPGATCDSTGRYALDADGSIAKDKLLNTYVTETWQRPSGCVARGADGTPLVHGTDEQVLPTHDSKECLEAPLMGVQFAPYATDQGTADANFGAAVDGNYGFGDGCFISVTPTVEPGQFDEATGTCFLGTLQPLPGARDYLVQVDLNSLMDSMTPPRPIYKVTREEDINIGNGDEFIPPAVPPSACAGALHTVDSTGNATFPGGPGTSPYEGQQRPLCDVKLVRLDNGKSIAPAFNLFTEVPIPGRHWFIVIDDLNFSSNPKSVTFGEKAGMPFVPVGIYDYTDRLITTVESDYNGLADVLLPSTNRINCPTPSGVCGNLYRYVGNDPGVPGRLNLNYNPSFRTIAAEFEVLPGQIIPADLAPTQVGVTVQLPGAQTTSPVSCKLDITTPQVFAVNRPYGSQGQSFAITGRGFGTTPGRVNFDGVPVPNSWSISWSDTSITVTPQNYGGPASSTAGGPHQLSITANNGQTTVNGLTYHYIRTTGGANDRYAPTILEVGPGKPYPPAETLPAAANHAIQRALDAAPAGALVVVYPNNPSANPRQNPRGAYYENLIITKRVKLQGVGPGSSDGSVRGSIIDGGAFAGDSPVATDWYTRIGTATWAGNQTIYDGAVISLFLTSNAFPTTYDAKTAPSIDGFDLRGGDQQGFPGNINAIGGGATGQPGGLITQGGAIFANAYARNLQITNNVVQNNGGAYGTIRIGTPDLPASDTNNHNEGVRIANNRVIANAGTNLAGGIGIFAGADNYEVARNDVCGNFSAEYGGGISVIGLQRNPPTNNGTYNVTNSIHDNRIYFNRSYDEAGGIMIAGALPANTTTLSPGSGPVDIYNNLIQANLANDDGGGIRFLMASSTCNRPNQAYGPCPINVYNNFIVNNVSTHEGGGIGINDAPNVRVYNNTIMKNLTTATAVTSNGAAAPAGLSTSMNSALLQARLPSGSPTFSNPLLFNNIFWDNRAGTRAVSNVTGLSIGDADHWDLGVADGPYMLAPTNSIVQQNAGTHPYTASPTNTSSDPIVVNEYDVAVTFNTWRNNPAFLGAILISADLPPNLMGDYHLTSTSPAINLGASSKSGVTAPTLDIDNQPRTGARDAGADEYASVAVAAANVSPTSLAFGNVSVGSSSAAQGLTLSNTGAAALNISSIGITPPFSRPAGGAGGTCGATLAAGANCTINLVFTPTTTGAATGRTTITASVAVTGSPVSLTGTGVAVPTLPALAVLDSFSRANANTLGGSWSQTTVIGFAAIRVNANQAQALLPGQAIWNLPPGGFGAKQGAALTIATTTPTGDSLILKATGGTATTPVNYARVRLTASTVVIETTTNSGGAFASAGTLNNANSTFANGDVLTAQVDAGGLVSVWRTRGATTVLVGSIQLPNNALWNTGGGRIGISLPTGARVDNFSGGTVP